MARPQQVSREAEGAGSELTLAEVASRAGVSAATVRRWVKDGLMPQYEGTWTPAAASQVRIVARLRERGHTIEQIRAATESGGLARLCRRMCPAPRGRYTLEEAAEARAE